MPEINDKKIRILHISDIHYSNNNKDAFERMVKAPFLEFIKEKNEEKQIDLICLTGDLINQGTGGFSSTEEALSNFDKGFLSPLIDVLKIDKQSIFICPGNHDVNRELDKDDENEIRQRLISKAEIQKSICEQRTIENHKGINRMLPFKRYEEAFYKDNINSKISYFDSYHARNINNVKVGILSVNTAWRCFNDDSKIILGINQIQNNYPKIQDNDFNILLSHYKIDQCSDIDTMTENIITNFNLCCYGHTHSSGSATIIDSRNRKTVISVSKGLIPSNWTEENQNYENGFSIIDIDLSSDDISVIVSPYTYSGAEKNNFVLDTPTLGQNEPAKYSLSKRIIHTEKIFSETIRNNYSECLYRLLNTQIDNYINRTISDSQNAETKFTIFEELKKYRKIVLLANAGMGKTFESIKLSQEILTNKNFDNYIPVFIKANLYKIDYEDLEEGIKKQLRPFTQTNTDKYYEDNIHDNIILIIDGLDEVIDKSKYRALVNEINEFAALYPKMFSFITCRSNQFHNDLFNYKDFILNPLTDWEIRGYLQKNKINESKFSSSYFELFKNPFLLTLAVKVYSQEEAFSKFYNKSKLLEQCCLFLAGKRDEEKGLEIPNMNFFKLFCEIGKIAFENFDKNSYTQVEFDEYFSSLFTASEAFGKFRNEIFVGGQNYEFKHRLFKEYLIAFYMYKTYPFSDDTFDFYKKIINDESYFEILSFVSGMITDIKTQNMFFDFLLENNFKLFLYCIIVKNDLSDQLQKLPFEDFSELYINIFFETYIKSLNLYFSNIIDLFDPMRGIDIDKIICCYGCFSEDRRMFYYWFDRISNPSKRVFIISPNEFQKADFQHTENCKNDQRTYRTNTINLSLSRLEGDSARYLAMREVYTNLKRILEEHILIESEYIICEYVNIIKNCFRETCNDNFISDIYKHFEEKLNKDSLLPNGQKCFIAAYNGIKTKEFLTKLSILKTLDFDLGIFPLPKKDQFPEIGYIGESYSKIEMEKYLNNFFYYSEIAYKNMVEKNFTNLKDYFSLYLDIPYQIIYNLETGKKDCFYNGVTYYHIPSNAIEYPCLRNGNITYKDFYNEMIQNTKGMHSASLCSSLIENFIPGGLENFPFSKYVYELIQKDIDSLFKDFKSF